MEKKFAAIIQQFIAVKNGMLNDTNLLQTLEEIINVTVAAFRNGHLTYYGLQQYTIAIQIADFRLHLLPEPLVSGLSRH